MFILHIVDDKYYMSHYICYITYAILYYVILHIVNRRNILVRQFLSMYLNYNNLYTTTQEYGNLWMSSVDVLV